MLLFLLLLMAGCGRDRGADATATAEAMAASVATPILRPTFTPTSSTMGGESTTASAAASGVTTTTQVVPTPTVRRTPPTPTATVTTDIQFAQAEYQYRIGDYAVARTTLTLLLNRLERQDPMVAAAQYLLARVYLAEGAYNEANAILDALATQLTAAPLASSAGATATATEAATAETVAAAGVVATTTTASNMTSTMTTVPTATFTAALALTVTAAPTPPVALPATNDALVAKSDYLQAVARSAQGDHEEAIAAYWRFLEVYPWMSEFVQAEIAAAYVALGDSDSAATAYRRAAAATEDRTAKAWLLEAMANAYVATGRYQEAVTAYDEILAIAQNAPYRAEIHYLAGQALVSAGDLPEATTRWRAATEEDPTAGAAYRALIELVNRNISFDLYQRGYIDLEAGAYVPAINAYQAYLDSVDATDSRVGLAMAGMGEAYIGAENYAAAVTILEQVTANYTECVCLGEAWLNLALAQAWLGDGAEARRIYRTFAREYPTDPLAPEALWRSGRLALNAGNQVEAAADFLRLADAFPESERAPLALYIVGFGAYQRGFVDQATLVYERLQSDYPEYNRPGVAFWLGRVYDASGDRTRAQGAWQTLVEEAPDSYYGILAAHAMRDLPLVAGNWMNAMTSVVGPMTTLADDDGSRAFAERWLMAWWDVQPSTLADTYTAMTSDQDVQIGRLLLDLDQRGNALSALGRAYTRHSDNPEELYALGMIFEELGAYRLSIMSMARLIELSPATLVEDAPIFLQEHVYPRHFADLITEEAVANGINPLLYFSLIRQESLFEEGARSFAAAQGLAQIIPDTGLWVAERLGHPEYTNEIIYRPHINLRFGAYYLAWTRDYLDGNIISALVGYNAGPGNAQAWRELTGADDTLFVELLTVNEPRIYVQTITVNLYHYTRLYRS